MAAATITPTEDQTFNALVRWLQLLLDIPRTSNQIVKGHQNLVAVPTGNYIVLSPAILQAQNFGAKTYNGLDAVLQTRNSTYSFQVDCYGQDGPDWANIIEISWRSMWGVDNMASGALTPLYADAAQQLNIVNSEGQFEQRRMVRLFGQVNATVTLPQDFFTAAELDSLIVADQLP